MKTWTICLCGGLLCAVPLKADELDGARAALADHLPAVAAVKANAVLRRNEGSPEARRIFARALAMDGKTTAALGELSRLEELSGQDLLLRATLHQRAGELEKSLADFRAAKRSDDSATQRTAVLGEAGILVQTGAAAEAISALQAALETDSDVRVRLTLARLLVDSGQADEARRQLGKADPRQPVDQTWKNYLAGRVALLDGREAEALAAFRGALAANRALTVELFDAAQLGSAHALLAQGKPEAAAELLEDFISAADDNQPPREGFELLDLAYSRAPDQLPRQLEKWVKSEPSPRTQLALFYLARAELRRGNPSKAEDHLVDFLAQAPAGHPLRMEARLSEAEILARREAWDEAMARIEEALNAGPDETMAVRLQMLGGWVRFQQRAFDDAAAYFSAAAAREPGPLQEDALFDIALARLNAHDLAGFLEAYRGFSASYPESPLRSDLIFEQGMLAARAGEDEAVETLQRFTQDFPNNQNVSRAYLALAETEWRKGRVTEAADYRRVALESDDLDVQAKARALLIFQLAESPEPSKQAQAIREGRKFLEEHPQSELVPEVRMKLGEIFFRGGDYGNARTQFEILARDFAKSPYAEPALFLAGQAAARSMNPEQALELFEQVARGESPLKLNARAEQARLKSQLGVDEEAVVLYDAVLKGEPDSELRFASLIGKGMSLVQLGEKNPAQREEALEVFDKVIAASTVTPAWRNEALYRKGKLLQQMDRPAEALAAFYDAISRTVSAPAETEVFWFYRAGAEAARLLEQRGEFRGAVSVYDKLAAIEGPRSAEMKERKEQIQLEHFLWDEDPAAVAAP